jgi:hypothetical protein
MTVATRFRHAGVILTRATTDPGDLDLPDHVDLDNAASVEQDGMAWLAKVWARPAVRDAVRLASAVLAARVEHLLADGGARPMKEARRVVVSVAFRVVRRGHHRVDRAGGS